MINYNKITYIDGVTPLNAANLNKLERAVSSLSQSSLFADEISEGEGIKVDKNRKGSLTISTKDCLFSSTIKRFEVVKQFDPESAEYDCLYLVLGDNNKMIGIYLGGILIYAPRE